MQRYLRSHLSERSLLDRSDTDAGRERSGTADLLADIAEVEERKSYLTAGYPSLFAWCVGRLRLCDQAALKRIQAARAARRFPAIFPAVAEGRLHLTAVVLLAPHLTEHNAEELLAAATDKTAAEIERFLAGRDRRGRARRAGARERAGAGARGRRAQGGRLGLGVWTVEFC